jgi:hypothetical protein
MPFSTAKTLESQGKMTLREYLLEREQELLHEIKALHHQIEALQADLVPREGELAEVRRAKNAIGGGIMGMPFEETGEKISTLAAAVIRQSAANLIAPSAAAASGLIGGEPASVLGAGLLTISSPYEKLTMKELAVKALGEHFKQGATTRQLVEFFKDAWARNIERTNLSPQISRLYSDGIIGRIPSSKKWFLIQKEGIIQGFKPYLYEAQIVWAGPEVAYEDDRYEPLDMTEGLLPYQKFATVGNRSHPVGPIVLLRPEEVPADYVLLEREIPAAPPDDEDDEDGDARLRAVVQGERTPEAQAVLDTLKKR